MPFTFMVRFGVSVIWRRIKFKQNILLVNSCPSSSTQRMSSANNLSKLSNVVFVVRVNPSLHEIHQWTRRRRSRTPPGYVEATAACAFLAQSCACDACHRERVEQNPSLHPKSPEAEPGSARHGPGQLQHRCKK